MQIWLIAENWPPRIGGIENYLTNIVKHLNKDSVRVFIPTFTRILKPSWLLFFAYIVCVALRKKPDVILCGKALVEGRIALLLKNMFGIPYIVCTYGMEIATWERHSRTKKHLVTVLQHAHHVLYINDKTKEALLRLGAHEEKMSALYPCIDTDALVKMSDPERVLQKYSIQQPYIITVARLVQRKGVDDLIEAFGLLRNDFLPSYEGRRGGVSDAQPTPSASPLSKGEKLPYSLVVVGDGPEKEHLEQRAKSLSVPVRFTGAINDTDLHALYSRATLFALTPKELIGDYEGFGIVYLEAAFFTLPIVGTHTGGVVEAVEDTKTGILVPQSDVAAIAHALQTLLDNKALAHEYGQAGKKRVLQNFQWKKAIKKLEEILKNVAI